MPLYFGMITNWWVEAGNAYKMNTLFLSKIIAIPLINFSPTMYLAGKVHNFLDREKQSL